MKTYELVVPCHFGLEAVLKREIYDLGYEISRVEESHFRGMRKLSAVPISFCARQNAC